jgi:hypothetical protein
VSDPSQVQVTSGETALLQWLDGEEGYPTANIMLGTHALSSCCCVWAFQKHWRNPGRSEAKLVPARLDFHYNATVDLVLAHPAEDAVYVFQPFGRVVRFHLARARKLQALGEIEAGPHD